MNRKIILGCGNFGGIGSSVSLQGNGENFVQAKELLQQALDLGISRFDTANTYGAGQSEEFIGNFFGSMSVFQRQKIELHSKVGNPNGIQFGQGSLSYKEIIFHAEGSLKRMRTDYIDLYLMHEPDPRSPLEESLKAFSKLLEAGKIRCFGFSNVDLQFLEKAYALMDERLSKKLYSVQNEFHYLNTQDENRLIPFLKSKKVFYTAYSPLAGGLLSGKYQLENDFPEGSRLQYISEPYRKYLNKDAFNKIQNLKSQAKQNRRSLPHEALRFLIEKDEIDFVVIGPRKKEHYENLGFKFN